MSHRLAVVCTHPIQYYVPVFRKLASNPDIQLQVFYGSRGTTDSFYDPDFCKTFRWDTDLLSGYDWVPVDNVALEPGSSSYSGIDLPTLNSEIAAWNPHAILLYGWCYKAHLRLLRHFHRSVPILFRGDSTLLDERRGLRKIARRIWLRWVYSHVDIALYVGSNNAAYFQKHGLLDQQLVFAPHAVDNEWFSSAVNRPRTDLRHKLCIPEDAIVALFAGKLESKKGPDLLVNAIRKTQDARVHLIFAGSGPMEGQLRKLKEPNVHFIGFQNQSEMPNAYFAADLVVLPSRGPGETWGLTINEAMASGRAVAASRRVGCAADLIQHKANGWVFEADNVESIAEILVDAAKMGRSKLKKMGERSTEIIRQWSFERQIEGILSAVDTACSIRQ